MKFTIKTALAVASMAGAMATAQAAPTLLGTITHNYGTAAGLDRPTSLLPQNGPVWCDTLNAGSVTVRTKSNAGYGSGQFCQNFADKFDFSGVDYESISALVLTLQFSDTAGGSCVFGFCSEQWRLRSASNLISAPEATSATNLTRSSGLTTQTFTLTRASLGASLFDQIVAGEAYYMWFANSGTSNNHNFNLMSASMAIQGEAPLGTVPLPGTLALAGLGLAALGWSRRRAA